MKLDKSRHEVIVYTLHHRLEGRMYTYRGARVLDELNAGIKTFIALTDVSVYSLTGNDLIYKAQFIALNKAHIVHVLPKGEAAQSFLPDEEKAFYYK
ncbi:hypothetical protein KKH65_03185 [bacterium]|nr:hypothetical protein [bacterium]